MNRHCGKWNETVNLEEVRGRLTCISHGQEVQCSESRCRYSLAATMRASLLGEAGVEFTDYTQDSMGAPSSALTPSARQTRITRDQLKEILTCAGSSEGEDRRTTQLMATQQQRVSPSLIIDLALLNARIPDQGGLACVVLLLSTVVPLALHIGWLDAVADFSAYRRWWVYAILIVGCLVLGGWLLEVLQRRAYRRVRGQAWATLRRAGLQPSELQCLIRADKEVHRSVQKVLEQLIEDDRRAPTRSYVRKLNPREKQTLSQLRRVGNQHPWPPPL